MRCTNCGWDNPNGVDRCQKCGQHLETADSQPQLQNTASITETTDDAEQVCPSCGYPLAVGVATCPMCGTSISNHLQQSSGKETVIMNRTPVSGKETVIFDRPSESCKETVILDRVQQPTRETVILNKASQPDSGNAAVSEENEVRLVCMDDGLQSEIKIVSAKNLQLHAGTIILIGELRYKVI